MITSFYIYLLKVSFCTGLFYAFYHFVLKKENFFQLNRMYIIGSVVLSLFIPYWQVDLNTATESAVDIYIGFDEYVVSEVSSAITLEEASVWGIEKVIFSIYIVGVILLFIKFLISLFYVLNLRMKNRIEKKDGYNIVHISQSHPVFSFFTMASGFFIFYDDFLVRSFRLFSRGNQSNNTS